MNKILFNELKTLCKSSVKRILTNPAYGIHDVLNEYTFKDNNSDILFVSHADTVFPACKDIYDLTINNKRFIYSPMLDDRLGLYTMLYYLPSMGINADWLITDHEESMSSSAMFFKTQKKYNWIVEFDRKELNPVLYMYNTPKIMDALHSVHIYPVRGSCSDISFMTHLNTVCINWSIGYRNEHTEYCHLKVSDYYACMEDFTRFYHKYKDIRFPFKEDYGKGNKKSVTDNNDAWKNTHVYSARTGWKKKDSTSKTISVYSPLDDVAYSACCDWCKAVAPSTWNENLLAYLCEDCASEYEDDNWMDIRK